MNEGNSDGSWTDEVRDPATMTSPVLQLLVMEVPLTVTSLEGRRSGGGRRSAAPSSGHFAKLSVEPHRRRHHAHVNAQENEEQSDSAHALLRRLPRPTPTLATLEDYDLMAEPPVVDADAFRRFTEQMLSSNRRSVRKVHSAKKNHHRKLNE